MIWPQQLVATTRYGWNPHVSEFNMFLRVAGAMFFRRQFLVLEASPKTATQDYSNSLQMMV